MADQDQTDQYLARSTQYLARSTHDVLREYLRDEGAEIAENLEMINRMMPAIFSGPTDLQIADKQISWGITRREGKYKVIILVEGNEIDRRLQDIDRHFSDVFVTPVNAQAHSFDPALAPQIRACASLPERAPGASIAHQSGYPGTLGCFVRTTGPGDWIGVISASHVIGRNNISKKGEQILSPGPPDGAKAISNVIGTVADFIMLSHFQAPEDNYLCCVDVALVKLIVDADHMDPHSLPNKTEAWSPKDPGIRMPIRNVIGGREVAERLGERVYKVGRTTGMTYGILDIVGLQRQRIVINSRHYIYTNVLAVKCLNGPFSKAGDSGALVYTEDGSAIGLVIAGTEEYTFVSPLDACLRDIKATLLH
jgi:hypothetical protein